MKLTPAQQSTLYDAARCRKPGLTGWFYPSRYELAEVYTTVATCRALCGRGFLEYETVDYVKRNGEWFPENKYRITDKGLQWVQENPITFTKAG